MVCPDCRKSSESSWGFDVSNETDHLEGRGLDDGNSFDFFFFIEFGFGSVDISEDVGHASFESTEGGEVRCFLFVISGERSYFSSVVFCSFTDYFVFNESEGTLSIRDSILVPHEEGQKRFPF